MKHIVTIILIAAFAHMASGSVLAAEKEAGSAAHLAYRFEQSVEDTRVLRLKAYLQQYNSPLAASADHFVSEADRLGLDWKFVAAIAGLESTYGHRIPVASYNAWGWGVFTGQQSGIVFSSWNDGITTVSEGLRNNYIDRGAITIEQIGAIYAASPTWASRVRGIMTSIEDFVPTDPQLMALTL